MDAPSSGKLALRRGGRKPLALRTGEGMERREGTSGHGSDTRRLAVDECGVLQSGIEDGELGKDGKDGKHLRDWAVPSSPTSPLGCPLGTQVAVSLIPGQAPRERSRAAREPAVLMTVPYDPLEHLPDPDKRLEVLVYARPQDLL